VLDKLHTLLASILHSDEQLFIPGQWSGPAAGENHKQPLPSGSGQREAKRVSGEPEVLTLAQFQSSSGEANDDAVRENTIDTIQEAGPTAMPSLVTGGADVEPERSAGSTVELHKLQTQTPPRGAIVNGEKLRQLRESLPEGERTMQFVADCLGVTLGTVSRAETQNRGGLATVYDYSRLFKVPMEELLIQE